MARERDRDAGERAGADANVPKPFSPIELIRTVTGLRIDAKEAPQHRQQCSAQWCGVFASVQKAGRSIAKVD